MSDAPIVLPDGEYAIVEILGHRTIIGRVEEVERFGSKLMSIEPLFRNELLPAVLIGGGSIYQFTPCTAERALARQPKEDWQLPASVRAVLPPELLPAPDLDNGPIVYGIDLGADDDIEDADFAPAFLRGEGD